MAKVKADRTWLVELWPKRGRLGTPGLLGHPVDPEHMGRGQIAREQAEPRARSSSRADGSGGRSGALLGALID
jgi:hypothetical protein